MSRWRWTTAFSNVAFPHLIRNAGRARALSPDQIWLDDDARFDGPVWVDKRDVEVFESFGFQLCGVHDILRNLRLMQRRGVPWWARAWRVRYWVASEWLLLLEALDELGWMHHKEGQRLRLRDLRPWRAAWYKDRAG